MTKTCFRFATRRDSLYRVDRVDVGAIRDSMGMETLAAIGCSRPRTVHGIRHSCRVLARRVATLRVMGAWAKLRCQGDLTGIRDCNWCLPSRG